MAAVRGVRVEAVLHVEHADLLTQNEVEQLREHKPALLQLLAGTGPLTAPAAPGRENAEPEAPQPLPAPKPPLQPAPAPAAPEAPAPPEEPYDERRVRLDRLALRNYLRSVQR
jgi:hypothetical protein